MEHFAKPDDELSTALKEKKLYRNFQGYSTNAGADLYAFGITSISQLKNIYAQNYKTEKEYYKALDDEQIPTAKGYRLTEDDQIRREVIMKLMCDFELNFKSIEDKFNINFKDYFAWGLNNLKEMQKDELVEISNEGITVKDMGRLLIRNIAMNFDGWTVSAIGRLSSGQPYSPTALRINVQSTFRNSENKPVKDNLDLFVRKEFNLLSTTGALFLRIYNVFDQANQLTVHPVTGTATRAHRFAVEKELDRERLTGLFTLNNVDTHLDWFSEPRKIELGLTISF